VIGRERRKSSAREVKCGRCGPAAGPTTRRGRPLPAAGMPREAGLLLHPVRPRGYVAGRLPGLSGTRARTPGRTAREQRADQVA
jgi:hypothetical protein